jgi:hypothetical protein
VSRRGTKDNCKDQVCLYADESVSIRKTSKQTYVVRHEHKHQEERQTHASSIQHSAHGTIERGHSESTDKAESAQWHVK